MNPLLDAVASPWREITVDGRVLSHPAWHDLTAEERVAAFEVTVTTRAIEAALDARGRTGTARAVLAQIRDGLRPTR